MPRRSAGLLMYRHRPQGLEVLLVRPGGPYFRKRDAGVWTIPKGEIGAGEDPEAAARREFEEETGLRPEGELLALAPVRMKSGKVVHAWAFCGECDPTTLRSNTFTIEWPPRSGRMQTFPEVESAAFFSLAEALARIVPAQAPLLQELAALVTRDVTPGSRVPP
jgi:predicted NUDIX family NTP pyrophosphohydrolase